MCLGLLIPEEDLPGAAEPVETGRSDLGCCCWMDETGAAMGAADVTADCDANSLRT